MAEPIAVNEIDAENMSYSDRASLLKSALQNKDIRGFVGVSNLRRAWTEGLEMALDNDPSFKDGVRVDFGDAVKISLLDLFPKNDNQREGAFFDQYCKALGITHTDSRDHRNDLVNIGLLANLPAGDIHCDTSIPGVKVEIRNLLGKNQIGFKIIVQK